MAERVIRHNALQVQRQFRRIRRDQWPFANALALTRVAQDGQREVRGQLSRRFTIRRRWVASGIRIERATKRRLESVVKSRDPFMTLQETGGVKRRNQAVPREIRRSAKTAVPRRRWPKSVLRTRPKAFVAKLPSGGTGVFERRGKARDRLRLLWVLPKRVTVKPRFEFEETVTRTVARNMNRRFNEAIEKALATAR